LISAEKGEKERFAKRTFMTEARLNEIGGIILDAAITVHRELGPGLLESAYQLALKRELELCGLNVKAKVPVELVYKGVQLGKAYEIDLLIEDEVIIENKSCDVINPIFIFQVITYLKLYHQKKLGYLINFNVRLLKDGFKRIVNNFSV
jgi:GxxExxY protein